MRTIAIAVAILTGCAGANYRPIIDTRGVDQNRYEADLRDCQGFAARAAGAVESAAAGAIVGAILGSIIAAAVGGNRQVRNQSSALGAVSGATGAGAQGEINQHDIVRRCVAGRGYSVLQ